MPSEIETLKQQLSEEKQKNTLLTGEVRAYALQYGAVSMARADAKALLEIVASGEGTKAGNAARARAWLENYSKMPEWSLPPSEAPSGGSDKALIGQLPPAANRYEGAGPLTEHGTARVLIDGEYQCACAACVLHREGARP